MEKAMERDTNQADTMWLCVGAVAAMAVVLLVAPDVMAGGSGMPWESTLTKILDSLQGPVARFAGIAAIVVTGLMFALGEGGQWFKKGLGIAFGLSIAFSATTFINQLGFSGGALI
jgi:type IV secretion system protein VirB2